MTSEPTSTPSTTKERIAEATRKTAENLGCSMDDLENAIKMIREMDENQRRESKAWKKMDEIIESGKTALNYWTIEHESNTTQLRHSIVSMIQELERFRDEEL